MMIDATIKINFGPASDIENSFIEAVRISKLLGVYTEFQFNGVTCIGRPDGDPSQGVKAYHNLVSDKTEFKTAIAFPSGEKPQFTIIDPVDTFTGSIPAQATYTREVWVNHFDNGEYLTYRSEESAKSLERDCCITVKATLTYDIPMTKV